MTDRPILFSAAMVAALLDGRKTQTRRALKLPLAPNHLGEWQVSTVGGPGILDGRGRETPEYPCVWHTRTGASVVPPFTVGDRLWVKETWRAHCAFDKYKPSLIGTEARIWYEADGRDNCDQHGKTRVSIFMPRWASRLTLIVTDVRVERLNDCSEADAIAEGIEARGIGSLWGWIDYLETNPNVTRHFSDPRVSYASLWDSINGEGAWASNPWVAAVSFTVQRGNIDQ